MPDILFKKFSQLDNVEAIAIGGSRAGKFFDEKSDYDVYVYVNSPINEEIRKDLLSQHCRYMEIGNSFWEYEDNCILNSGIDIDILYRNLDEFCQNIENVVLYSQISNAYNTCMWHNLLNCKIVFDRNGKLTAAQKKYDIPYPKKLKTAIIKRQLKLLSDSMPAYNTQIKKAFARNDLVSINHRITEFLASYFDLIFALNEKTHYGEKRLISLCKSECKILPADFEKNLVSLFKNMYNDDNGATALKDLETIITNIKQLVSEQKCI